MLPPKIVRVLPPEVRFRDGLAISVRITLAALVILVAFVGAIVVIPLARAGGPWLDAAVAYAVLDTLRQPWIIGSFTLVLACGLVLLWVDLRSTNMKRCKTRQRLLESDASIADDPDSTTLARLWSKAPTSSDVRLAPMMLKTLGPADRTRIVYGGQVDIPTVPDVPVEPLVIAPASTLRARGAGGIALFLSAYAAYLILAPGMPRYGAPLAAAGALLAATTWAWHVLIHPRYLRVAPGIVQTLRYSLPRAVPTTTDYPFDARTALFIAVNRQNKTTPFRVSLTLRHDARSESFVFETRDAALIERFWQVLLSTAPAGPLSSSELVG